MCIGSTFVSEEDVAGAEGSARCPDPASPSSPLYVCCCAPDHKIARPKCEYELSGRGLNASIARAATVTDVLADEVGPRGVAHQVPHQGRLHPPPMAARHRTASFEQSRRRLMFRAVTTGPASRIHAARSLLVCAVPVTGTMCQVESPGRRQTAYTGHSPLRVLVRRFDMTAM